MELAQRLLEGFFSQPHWPLPWSRNTPMTALSGSGAINLPPRRWRLASWWGETRARLCRSEPMVKLHFLAGCAPELNSDELVWPLKRTGTAKRALASNESLQDVARPTLSISRTIVPSSDPSSRLRMSPILLTG